MPMYRCPACGASHKEEAENCRLCGQSFRPDAVNLNESKARQIVAPKKGMKGAAWVGIGLVLAVIGVALVLGVVKPTSQMENLAETVQGRDDGWSDQVDEEGRFAVELPGTRTHESVPFVGTDDGKLMAWTADVVGDTTLMAGFGSVAATSPEPTTTGTGESTQAKLLRIRETVVTKWMAGNGLTDAFVTKTDSTLGGLPAVVVKTTGPRLKLETKDAYAQVAFAIDKDRLYVVETRSIYKDAEQFTRMVDTFRRASSA